MSWERAKDLGGRIKDLRTAMGLLQEDFAELAGVTSQSISDYETGRSQPSKSRLERLAKRVGIPVAGFEKDGPMPSTLLRRPAKPSNGNHARTTQGAGSAVAEGSVRYGPGDGFRQIVDEMKDYASRGEAAPVTQLNHWLRLVASSGAADPAAQLEEIVEQSKGEGPGESLHPPLPAEKAPRRRALEG